MGDIISKEELDLLNKVEGLVRGTGLKITADFVLRERGEGGLKLLEEKMAELGYQVNYKEVKLRGFYPLKIDAINFLVASRLFDFDDKKMYEIGKALATTPIVVKLSVKYVVSFNRAVGAVSRLWDQSYPIGSLKIIDVSRKEKYLILRLEDFNILPLYCPLLSGFFVTVLQMVVRKEATCEETKCSFRGDPYHEFLLKW